MGKPRKSVGRHKRAGGLLEPWATNGEDRLSQTRGLLERFTKRIIVRVSKEVNIEQPEHWKVRTRLISAPFRPRMARRPPNQHRHVTNLKPSRIDSPAPSSGPR